MILPYYSFTVQANNSSISSLVIMRKGRVIVVPCVATLIGREHGCDVGGGDC